MAFTSLFNGLALACLALWLSLPAVNAAFWTVTSKFQLETSVSTDVYGSTRSYFYTYSTTRTIVSTATPTKSAVRTSTYERTAYDLEILSVYYPPDAVAESDLEPTSTYGIYTSDYTYTLYSMPVVWAAPATCSSKFNFSTTIAVYPPSEVSDQLTPTSTRRATGYYSDSVTAYLTPSAVPINTETEYYYSAYVASCSKPYSYSSSSDDDDDDDDYYSGVRVCYLYSSGCTSLKTWIIIIATILPALFLIGFLESFLWFRRLMIGKSALRFGTVSWVLLSLWVVCFTRKQAARSLEDQKALREQWKSWGFGKKLGLWFKWGFRHRYPTELLGQYSPNTVGVVPNAPHSGPNGQPPYYGPGAPPPMYDEKGQLVVVQHPVSVYGAPPQVPGQAPPGQFVPYPPQQVPGQFAYQQVPPNQFVPQQPAPVATQYPSGVPSTISTQVPSGGVPSEVPDRSLSPQVPSTVSSPAPTNAVPVTQTQPQLGVGEIQTPSPPIPAPYEPVGSSTVVTDQQQTSASYGAPTAPPHSGNANQ